MIQEKQICVPPAISAEAQEAWNDNGKVLVFLHGGGYTLFSARSTLVGQVHQRRPAPVNAVSQEKGIVR